MMSIVEQKEIYLVPFPFSDFNSNKVRPVLIVSNNSFNKNSQDVIICAITRNSNSQHSINIKDEDMKRGKILYNSYIKVENICFINKELLIKNLGKISDNKFTKVKITLDKIIS